MVVTGAGAGLGRAISLACAQAGAAVVVAGPGDNAAETADIVAAQGGRAVFARTDVTVAHQVEAAIGSALSTFGRLDGVVHNATSRRSSDVVPIEAIDDAAWDDHVAVSLRGAYHCARFAQPHLERHGGRLLFMTSPAAMEGSSALPAYAAVKGAVRGFAKSLAVEWGPTGVGVVTLSPLAHTSALDRAFLANPELEERLARVVPLGRIGDPDTDIAPVVVFLLSDDARYLTGQTVIVDGGRFTTL